jgi:hypothetical protein
MTEMKKQLGYLFIIIGLVGCNLDKVPEPTGPPANELIITVQPEFAGQIMHLDSVYTTNEGYDVKFTELKFFMEGVVGVDSILIDAGLFNYKANGISMISTFGNPSDFDSIYCNLGVDKTRNHADPTLFPVGSVLNITNANDMHWNWNPGYIFAKIEAVVDTIQDGNSVFDHNVVFHVGGDPNKQLLAFEGVNWNQIEDYKYHLPLKVDMSVFLSGAAQVIDLKSEFVSHTGPTEDAITLKVMQNLAGAISVY